MRHKLAHRKLSRTSAHRRALLRNLATSLILSGKCETTVEKAKEIKRVVEKLVTKARTDTLSNRRLAYSYFLDKRAVHKLFAELAPRYKDRKGGYTRIVRTSFRLGDAAEKAVIEFVNEGTVSQKRRSARRVGRSLAEPNKEDVNSVQG